MPGETLFNVLLILLHAGLTTMFLFYAGVFFLEFYAGLRGAYMLWAVFAFVCLSVFFFMLSISSGSHPVIPRGNIAFYIRTLELLVLVAGYAWVGLRLRNHIVINWRDRPAKESQ